MLSDESSIESDDEIEGLEQLSEDDGELAGFYIPQPLKEGFTSVKGPEQFMESFEEKQGALTTANAGKGGLKIAPEYQRAFKNPKTPVNVGSSAKADSKGEISTRSFKYAEIAVETYNQEAK